MQERLHSLSEREKETLRLLFKGHDAKSAAVALGLSVHTVNERLREARRKLGVGSSRTAARLLAQAEAQSPNFLGDMELGVAATKARGGEPEASTQRRRVGRSVAWLSGGLAIMFAIVAAAAIAMALHGGGKVSPPAPPVALSASSSASDQASTASAEAWAKLLDGQRWAESWKASGAVFRSKLTSDGWTATIQPLRRQLGPVSARSLKSVSSASSLPGVPDGEYKIVQFATVFANKPDAVETVVLTHENAAWKVNGYFIR
jgi:DNA-binding CsgD family transcriptional regulator